MSNTKPTTIDAISVQPSRRGGYPDPYSERVRGRERRRIGDFFDLQNFGVNLTRLEPGSESALLHTHTKQDELIYILAGTPTLITESDETVMKPGMCAGFPAGGEAHHLINQTDKDVVLLEIGDRPSGDMPIYPEDDLTLVETGDGERFWSHKNGELYDP